MAQSFSKTVTDGKVMASGIKANAGVLAKHGIDESFADNLNAKADRVMELNNEQEMLKGRLKEKTVELKTEIDALEKDTALAKKFVKIDIPKEAWKEFGITAKR